jgi:CBS domain-containing protein
MPISEICNTEVVTTGRKASVQDAARLMREHHVGDVVVVDERDGERVPVGIVTDRDIVVEVVAKGVPMDTLTAGDIMSLDLVTAQENDGVYETIQMMRVKGVRRLPVVNLRGGLLGILSVDDVIGLLSDEMGEVAHLISHEQTVEKRVRV